MYLSWIYEVEYLVYSSAVVDEGIATSRIIKNHSLCFRVNYEQSCSRGEKVTAVADS